MDFSRGIANMTDISLGGVEIATDFLSNPDLYEPELTEVKAVISKKDPKLIRKGPKPIKPKKTRESIMSKFSLVPHEKVTVQTDEYVVNDLDIEQVNLGVDDDFNFDDFDDLIEKEKEIEPAKVKELSSEEDTRNSIMLAIMQAQQNSTSEEEETPEEEENQQLSNEIDNIFTDNVFEDEDEQYDEPDETPEEEDESEENIFDDILDEADKIEDKKPETIQKEPVQEVKEETKSDEDDFGIDMSSLFEDEEDPDDYDEDQDDYDEDQDDYDEDPDIEENIKPEQKPLPEIKKVEPVKQERTVEDELDNILGDDEDPDEEEDELENGLDSLFDDDSDDDEYDDDNGSISIPPQSKVETVKVEKTVPTVNTQPVKTPVTDEEESDNEDDFNSLFDSEDMQGLFDDGDPDEEGLEDEIEIPTEVPKYTPPQKVNTPTSSQSTPVTQPPVQQTPQSQIVQPVTDILQEKDKEIAEYKAQQAVMQKQMLDMQKMMLEMQKQMLSNKQEGSVKDAVDLEGKYKENINRPKKDVNIETSEKIARAKKLKEESVKKVAKAVAVKEEAKPKIDNIARYNEMPVEKLYAEVRSTMTKLGVNKKLVDINTLNEKFGEANIRKLIQKSYLIKIGKNITAAK
jgi:hypothetical protein